MHTTHKYLGAGLLLSALLPATASFAACPSGFLGPVTSVDVVADFDGDKLNDRVVNGNGATPVAIGSRLVVKVKNGAPWPSAGVDLKASLLAGPNYPVTLLDGQGTVDACAATSVEVSLPRASGNSPSRQRGGKS